MRAPDRLALALVMGLSAPVVIAGACGDQAEIPSDVSSSVASGLAGAPPTDAGDGGRGGSVGQGGEGGTGAGGAPPTVLVGLVANPRADGAPVSVADRLSAAAAAYAAGARVATLQRRWRDLDATTLAEDLAIARAGCAAEGACRPIVFTLAIVEGEVDGRPEPLQVEPWDSTPTRAELEAAVAMVIDAMGPDLAVLTLGARADRWLATHEDDVVGLGSLLEVGTAHAREIGGDALLVGVGLSHDAALAAEGPGPALRSLGTASTLSLRPGAAEPGEPLPSPSSIAQLLDEIAALSPGKPVALVEAGFPTSPALGADEATQAVFLDALFSAIDARRETFPVLVVSRMHDLGDEACAAEGLDLPEEGPEASAYRCSTGLRDEEGLEKPAWDSFLAGAARLATGGTGPSP